MTPDSGVKSKEVKTQKALQEKICCRRGLKVSTTLQSIMNANLSQHRFWHCHENRLIKTIQAIPHNLYVSSKLASLY